MFIQRRVLPLFLGSVFCLSTMTGVCAAPIRVMALGDSITAGVPTQNYRMVLAEKARQVACDIDFVGEYYDLIPTASSKHSAIWGVKADAVDQVYIDGWAQQAKPDVVLTLLGGNDSYDNNKPAVNTIADLRSIIAKMRNVNQNIKILLGQYPDINPAYPRFAELKSLIPGLAATETTLQSPIVVVDHSVNYDVTIGADTYDGVHPSVNGDRKYANNWFKALVNAGVCVSVPVLSNATFNKPVSVSSSIYGYGDPVLAVNDIINDAGWVRSTDGAPQILEVDLQGSYRLSYFELSHNLAVGAYDTPYLFNTKAYEIAVSTDGINWPTVVTVTDNDKGKTTHKIPETNARYVRLTLNPPFDGGLINIREFRAIGLPLSMPFKAPLKK
ncbi:GDSL-type esterase/lipase family protein [Neisseriaceae bacterium TC5R-5]|nr:GDSL-type esterase/lipase family protein [Neisseriaceae bacterium TC5R-5]